MPSSYSQNGFELQAAGENLNTWGAPKLNNTLKRANYLVTGYLAVALTGDLTLTSSNTSATQSDFQAYNGLLKFTGTLTSNATITVPSVGMRWAVWNATNKVLTFTTGAGNTVTVDAGDKTVIWCDGTNVNTITFGGYSLKDFIAASVLAATGSLPATAGNDGKILIVSGGSWVPYSWTADAAAVRLGSSSTTAATPAGLFGSAAVATLTDAATVSWDTTQGYNARVTLGGNRTIAAPTGLQDGVTYTLFLKQDGTGSRTVTFNSIFDFGSSGTPTLSTGAGKTDKIVCQYNADRTKLECSFWKAA